MKPNTIRGAGVIFLLALCWQGWTVHARTQTWQVPVIFASVGIIGLAFMLWLAKREQEKQEQHDLQQARPPGPQRIEIRRFK